MRDDFIPFALPAIGQEEIDAVIRCLQSGWLTTGQLAQDFETAFSRSVGAEFSVAVSSGTAALHLALEALGVSPGDKVVTTTMTFTATAEVIRYLGADPVFVDIEPNTMNISSAAVEEAIIEHDNVKVILPVHFAGLACDMTSLQALATRFGCRILEDAAHALPTRYEGRPIGSISDATAFSFYATKTMTTAEGGMLTTNNSELAERARIMRLHGISRDVFKRYSSRVPSWFYEVVAPGYKYNLPDILAAIGLEQLKKLSALQERREEISKRYNDAFQDLPVRLPPIAGENNLHAWHLYVLQLELEKLQIDRDTFLVEMSRLGIGTSVHFIPLHFQPYWRDTYTLDPAKFPVASDIYRRSVSLPIYPTMTDQDVDRVIAAVRNVVSDAV